MALPSKEAIVSEKQEFPVVEMPMAPEIPIGIERAQPIPGAQITMPQPVTDDAGQIILDNAAPQQVTVTLPLSEEEMNQALHIKIIYSLRWLAEWMKRLTKITISKFSYKLGPAGSEGEQV